MFLVIAIIGLVLCYTVSWGSVTIEDAPADMNLDISIDDEGKISDLEGKPGWSTMEVGDDYFQDDTLEEWEEDTSMAIIGFIIMIIASAILIGISGLRFSDKNVTTGVSLGVILIIAVIMISSLLVLLSGANFLGRQITDLHEHNLLSDRGYNSWDPDDTNYNPMMLFFNGYIMFVLGGMMVFMTTGLMKSYLIRYKRKVKA